MYTSPGQLMRRFQPRDSSVYDYAIALAVTLLALSISWLLRSIVVEAPFLFFFAAVVVSAWLGGLGPGMVSATISIFAVDYFLTEPLYMIVDSSVDLLKFGIFAMIAYLVGWIEERRSQSERSLRELREELSVILDGVVDGITAQDESGNVIFANAAAAKFNGYESSNLMVRPPDAKVQSKIDMFDAETNPLPPNELPGSQVFRHGKRASRVVKMRSKDTGDERWIDLSSAPIFERPGKVKLAVNIFRDITGSIERQRELNRYAAIVASSNDAIVGKTLDGKITSWNPAAEKLYGHTQDEAIGQHISFIFPPRIKSRELELLNRIHAGETIEHYETKRQHKDGQSIDILLTISPIYTSDGTLTGYSTNEHDITNHKRREAEILRLTSLLATQREHLNAIISNVPGIIFDTTMDLENDTQEINFVSPYAEEMLGYPPDKWYEHEDFWSEIIEAEDLAAALEEAKEAFDNERSGTSQFRVCHANGDTVFAESFFTFVERDDKIKQYGVIMDITQRKIFEDALQEYMDELARSNEELEQFAYVASHDLQEPLRMVTSYLQLIERRYNDKLDDDGKEFIDFAVDGASRMKILINDLLAYSRVQRSNATFEQVNMQDVVEKVKANLRVKIEETDSTITQDDLPIVYGSEGQMVQLVQNLVANSIKFCKDAPPIIHIGVKKRDKHFEFFVQDNGIGIAPEYQERIFVIFQRLHTRADYPGTGIGLAICRKIVQKHRGEIWVESHSGDGTTFYFTIPTEQRKRVYAGN